MVRRPVPGFESRGLLQTRGDRHLGEGHHRRPLSGSALDASWAVRAQLVNVPLLSMHESQLFGNERGVGHPAATKGLCGADGVQSVEFRRAPVIPNAKA